MKIALIAAMTLALGATAFAGEVVKKDTKAPTVSAKAMTDKDMDKVTAGNSAASVNCCYAGNNVYNVENRGRGTVDQSNPNYQAYNNGFQGSYK